MPSTIWTDYFNEIVRLIPGASVEHGRSKAGNEWDDVVFDDEARPLESLFARKDEWRAAVDLAVKRVKEALAKQSKK